MTNFQDPVTLTGGDLGGTVIEGKGWKVGTIKVCTSDSKAQLEYRRMIDDGEHNTADMAVFHGKVKKK